MPPTKSDNFKVGFTLSIDPVRPSDGKMADSVMQPETCGMHSNTVHYQFWDVQTMLHSVGNVTKE